MAWIVDDAFPLGGRAAGGRPRRSLV